MSNTDNTDLSSRYCASIAWQFLLNKFLKTSPENTSNRLNLILQPLISTHVDTPEIWAVKFGPWWELMLAIEPFTEKYTVDVLHKFLDFCFGPVCDSSVKNERNDTLSTELCCHHPGNCRCVAKYPLVTVNQMKTLVHERSDALSQILNLNYEYSETESKLWRFRSPVIIEPQVFLCLSTMIIHCVGECTVLIVDSSDIEAQKKKFYLNEIWKNLLLHIKRVETLPPKTSENNFASSKEDKCELIKNLFRALEKLHELSTHNQELSNVCQSPIIETILSSENGLSDEILISNNKHINESDPRKTPLCIIVHILLSPQFLSFKHGNEDLNKRGTSYMDLLQSAFRIGMGLPDITIFITQTVMKMLSKAVGHNYVNGSRIKDIWILIARVLSSDYFKLEKVLQRSEEQVFLKCLLTVLMFPVIHTEMFVSDQELIVKSWSQLYEAFQKNVFKSVCTIVGNEICNEWCKKVQKVLKKKKIIGCDELLCIMRLLTSAVEKIPFQAVNKLMEEVADAEKKSAASGSTSNCYRYQ